MLKVCDVDSERMLLRVERDKPFYDPAWIAALVGHRALALAMGPPGPEWSERCS